MHAGYTEGVTHILTLVTEKIEMSDESARSASQNDETNNTTKDESQVLRSI